MSLFRCPPVNPKNGCKVVTNLSQLFPGCCPKEVCYSNANGPSVVPPQSSSASSSSST